MYIQSIDPFDYLQQTHVKIGGLINIQYEKIIAYDDMTALHCARVAAYASDLARRCGMDVRKISEAGLVHDLGKIYLRHQMINKTGALSPLEKECVDRHAYYGYRMLKDVCADEEICIMVLCHHSIDALSYTYEDVSESAIKGAMILKAADIFDAVTSNRPYRAALSPQTALYILDDSDVPQELIDHFVAVAMQMDICNVHAM